MIGYPAAIVQQQLTLASNQTAGIVSGSVFGTIQISCGNIQSTEWIVQQFKASNRPSGLPLYYCLNSPTTFNPATAQPCPGSAIDAKFYPSYELTQVASLSAAVREGHSRIVSAVPPFPVTDYCFCFGLGDFAPAFFAPGTPFSEPCCSMGPRNTLNISLSSQNNCPPLA